MNNDGKDNSKETVNTETSPDKNSFTSTTKRSIRHINPLGMRVVVRIPTEQNISEGGLYLPEGAKSAMEESVLCEVVAVASAMDEHTDEETNVSGVPLGARVLIPKNAGTRIPWDDKLRIVETKQVLAVVEQINLS